MKENIAIAAFVALMFGLAGLLFASDYRPERPSLTDTVRRIERQQAAILAILEDRERPHMIQAVNVEAESTAKQTPASKLADYILAIHEETHGATSN